MPFRTDARIFVAGHRGLVGSAVVRRLSAGGFTHVLTATRDQLDLRDQAAVNYWFRANRPEFVFLYTRRICTAWSASSISEARVSTRATAGSR
jgi:nucleoside-diphosphate-sugar epimerase